MFGKTFLTSVMRRGRTKLLERLHPLLKDPANNWLCWLPEAEGCTSWYSKGLKPQNWHLEEARGPAGTGELTDLSGAGVSHPWESQLHPFPGGNSPPIIPTVFHSFLVSENIYSKTGIEKTVQSICC